MPEAAGEAGERREGPNLAPPAEGFELYRNKNADETKTEGWSSMYWARRNAARDYEIRAVPGEGEAYSVPGGVFARRVSRSTTKRSCHEALLWSGGFLNRESEVRTFRGAARGAYRVFFEGATCGAMATSVP